MESCNKNTLDNHFSKCKITNEQEPNKLQDQQADQYMNGTFQI